MILSQLKTGKLVTSTFKIITLVIFSTLLIYFHDLIPKGYGEIGKSSLRVYLYTVSAELRFLLTWLIIYYLAKGKQWRFVIWLPVAMTIYQLIIRVFSLQKSTYNDFDVKLIVTMVLFISLIVFYFYSKKDRK